MHPVRAASAFLLFAAIPIQAFAPTICNHWTQQYRQTKRTKSLCATTEEDEQTFLARTKELCAERNFPLAKVKNARDLASVQHCQIKPKRIIRTGRVSDATAEDLEILSGDIGIRTLVDLRSMTELKDDPTLDREEVFKDYATIIYDERKNIVKELNEDEPRIRNKKNVLGHVKDLVGGVRTGVDTATHLKNDTDTTAETTPSASKGLEEEPLDAGLVKILDAAANLADATGACDGGDCGDDLSNIHHDDDYDEDTAAHKRFVKVDPADVFAQDETRGTRKERHFVSIMNEMKYVRGTLSKVRKRDIAKVLMKSPGAIVSKRVRTSCKDVFMTEINDGGLHMMNDLLLRFGAPGMKYVLDLCKDRDRHPIAFYCTAGKDRTGMIAALMLAAAGVPDEDIVEDYSLSANVYAEMNDHQAMVGALSQRNLDAKKFLGAPPEVMRDTLSNIRETYGSIEGYLDFIGFTEDDREELRSALMDE